MLVDEFGMDPEGWRRMPFVTFQAWQRLASVRRFNRAQREGVK